MKRFILILVIFISISFNTILKASDSSLSSYYNLRDEYIIKTPNQTMFNNCYSFATMKSLETCLAKATGEFYDFSEAYLTLIQKKVSPYVTIGATGSDLRSCYDYMKTYGSLLEEDCKFENLFYVNDSNFEETFNYYYNMSDKDIINRVSVNTYTFDQKDAIKRHIMSNGSVNLNMVNVDYGKHPNNSTYYAKQSSTAGGHAVSIIGWDDNYSVVIDGKTYNGAFIVLNSYGSSSQNDGVFYYLYDYLYTGTKLYGFTYNGDKMDLVNTTKSNYTIDICNVNNSDNNFIPSKGICKNSNVYTNSIDSITFNYKEYIKSFKLDILNNNISSDDFSFNVSSNTITLKPIKMISGKYKVVFYINNEVYVKEIYIMDNLDIESVCFSFTNLIAQYTSFEVSGNNKDLFIKKGSSGASLLLTVSPYFNLTSYKVSSNDLSVIQSLDINRLYVIISNSNSGIYNYELTLCNSMSEVTYNITYCCGDYKIVNTLHSFNNHYLNYTSLCVLGSNSSYNLDGKCFNSYRYISSSVSGNKCSSITLSDVKYNDGKNAYLNRYPQLSDYKYQVIVDGIYSDNRIIESFENENINASLRLYNIEKTITDIDLRVGGELKFDSLSGFSDVTYGIVILSSNSDISSVSNYIDSLCVSNNTSRLEEINKLVNSGYALKTKYVITSNGFVQSWVISNSDVSNYDKEIICSHFMIYNDEVYFSLSNKYTIRRVIKTYNDMIDNNTLDVYDWIKQELRRYYDI